MITGFAFSVVGVAASFWLHSSTPVFQSMSEWQLLLVFGALLQLSAATLRRRASVVAPGETSIPTPVIAVTAASESKAA